MDEQGLAGIYPSCLIKLEQESAELLRYCDIEIYKYAGFWEHTLQAGILLGIDYDQYPHHASFLSTRTTRPSSPTRLGMVW